MCSVCKKERACRVFDSKGRSRVRSRHKVPADCTTENRQQTTLTVLTGKQGLTSALVFRDLQYFAAEFMSWIQLDIKGSRCVGLGWITAVGLFRSTVGLSAGSDWSGWINSERARTPASNSNGPTMWQAWWYMIGTPYWTLEFNDVIGIAILGLLGRKIFLFSSV